MKRNTTVTIDDLIDIIKACKEFDPDLKDQVIFSLNSTLNLGLVGTVRIDMSRNEVDRLFNIANSQSAKDALEKVFFTKKELDLHRIKPCSVVKIKGSSDSWFGGSLYGVEARVVFRDKPYFIDVQGKFISTSSKNKIWTFEHNGKFCSFHANNGADFIEEVIKY